MQLTALPQVGLVDEPVEWLVEGVESGSSVCLRVSGTDAACQDWRSEGHYRVGVDGKLEIADPDGPWTTMLPVDTHGPSVTFTSPEETWRCRAVATSDESEASTTVVRLYRRQVARHELTGQGWRLWCYEPSAGPEGSDPAPAVLIVSGSTGMAAMAPTAALLASRGYASAVLGYVQQPGLPESMRAIPVEILGEASDAFTALDAVDDHRLVVWSVSVGTGLALSALSGTFPRPLRGVVAASPTDVVWQALGASGPPPKASSLSRESQELPWLRIRGERLVGQMLFHALTRRLPGRRRSTAMRLYPAFDRTKDDPTTVAAAVIPVERIAVPMLLVAGTGDAMWPSPEMARAIVERRREHGAGQDDELLVLPDTGHFIRPPATPTTVDHNADLVSGGTPEGTAHGQRIAWTAALAFLDRVTRPATDGE
jgi:alpha-beta hydrolase superfamily lysophospholipase